MSKKLKINFKMTPKVTWITSDIPDYEDFVDNWNECHDGEVEPPEEGSQEFWDAVNDEQTMNWEDFRTNFKYGHLIGKTCLFRGRYSSRYPDFQPSCDAGRVITIDSIDDFMKFTGDHPDNVDIWTDKDGLHVQNAHHDGTLSLVVKTLTRRARNTGNACAARTKASPASATSTWTKPRASPVPSTTTSTNFHSGARTARWGA